MFNNFNTFMTLPDQFKTKNVIELMKIKESAFKARDGLRQLKKLKMSYDFQIRQKRISPGD